MIIVIRAYIATILIGEKNDKEFCAVHLVNEGLIIKGTSASLFFRGTNAVDSYRCRLRSVSRDTGFTSCKLAHT